MSPAKWERKGKLGGQADVKGVGGVWRGLTDNVNLMASNRETSASTPTSPMLQLRVANGDLSQEDYS